MRLYLINPSNPLISVTDVQGSRWNRFRIWKPLGLLTVAGLTPPDWEIAICDENVAVPDYQAMPRPDLVGLTAFTSQAPRAYELAAEFRRQGVPVVMGGIHATMCLDEARERVDAVVTGEAESVWAQVLKDVGNDELKPVYSGELLGLEHVPMARHDLLSTGYAIGSIQTSRGCPLNCSFCSVSSFNGRQFRRRPIPDVIAELKTIREKLMLVVDDNLVGITAEHMAYAKDLCRAIIQAGIKKSWAVQATINMADDEELLRLAAEAGCFAAFIGFESPSTEGLTEVRKKFNVGKKRDLKASVRCIQRHGIGVIGSFIMGLDADRPGIGRRVAETALDFDIDILNVMFLTPLPGTHLWGEMDTQGRILADDFPADWQQYTLTNPTMQYRHLSWEGLISENEVCSRQFYSRRRVAQRLVRNLWRTRHPFRSLIANFTYRRNAIATYRDRFRDLDVARGRPLEE